MDERRDGRFEVVLAFAQLIPVGGAADRADGGEGRIGITVRGTPGRANSSLGRYFTLVPPL
jgi:hypothetical protein